MSSAWMLQNLPAYWLQVALVGLAATIAPRLCRLESAGVRCVYWRMVLLVCALLPWMQPWRPAREAGVGSLAGTSVLQWQVMAWGEDRTALGAGTALLALLIGGAICRLLWMLVGYCRIGAICRRARTLESAAYDDLFERVGVRARLVVSAEVSGPAAVGVWHRVILLPESFASRAYEVQRAIVCHELLHLRRGDSYSVLAEQLVLSLLWFHPAIHWIIAQIELAREQAVDHEAVAVTAARDTYLTALLETARGGRRDALHTSLTFLKHQHLKQRVVALLQEASMSRTKLAWSLAATAILFFSLTGFAAWSFPMADAGGGHPPQAGTVGELEKEGGKVTPPRVIYKVEPEYTEVAKEGKVEGRVILLVTIGATGDVTRAEVTTSLDAGLDQNAVSAVSAWKCHHRDQLPAEVMCEGKR
jgi:TonB family protein